MPKVKSKDGTEIAYTKVGTGPALIIVFGATAFRGTSPEEATLAEMLSPNFTVITYDRRGRGESGNTLPFAPRREIEDIAALIKMAGGRANRPRLFLGLGRRARSRGIRSPDRQARDVRAARDPPRPALPAAARRLRRDPQPSRRLGRQGRALRLLHAEPRHAARGHRANEEHPDLAGDGEHRSDHRLRRPVHVRCVLHRKQSSRPAGSTRKCRCSSSTATRPSRS